MEPRRGRQKSLGFLLGLWLLVPAFGQPRELRLAIADYPSSINPVYATSETGQAVLNKLFHALFRDDGAGGIQPEIAESWIIASDGLSLRIILKRGLAFPSGRMLEASDVAATFALLRDPRFAFPYRSDLDFIAAIEAPEPHTLLIRLARPQASWRTYLVFKVMAADEIARADPATFARFEPSGTGPYRVVRQVPPRELVLERNPAYRGTLPAQKIVYTVLLDPRTMPGKLAAGEVEAGEIQPEDAELFARTPSWQRKFKLLRYEKYGFTYLVFNTRRSRLDREFRRTVYRRLVSGSFVQRFLRGRGRPVFSPILALGPQKPLPSPVSRSGTGAAIRVRLLTNSESRIRRHFVLFATEELKKDGIAVEPVFLEYHSFMKALRSGEFDLAISAFLLDLDYNVRDILASDGAVNYSGFADPRLDQLLRDGLAEMDQNRRTAIYRRIHQHWGEELPIVPLFSLYYHMGVTGALRPPARPVRVIGSCGDFFADIGKWALAPP